ncbi:hypothetical protein DXG01_008371 [Tephrocybe rancida]|nr:hypothetical protein DXG01_008371 [Tephrocybe rancida]
MDSPQSIETTLLAPVLPPIASLTYDTLSRVFRMVDGSHATGFGVFGRFTTRTTQLYYIALTCKAFVDPALDQLWRSMDSILPLIRILPMLELVADIYMLTRNPEIHERKRLEIYAQRIQFVTLTGPQPVIAPFTLMQLMSLLPNVQGISCSSDLLTTSTLPILLSEGLRRVEISTPKQGSHPIPTQSFLYTLRAKVPNLESLVIRSTLGPHTAKVVSSFNNLRMMDVTLGRDVSEPDLVQIFTLPEVQTLAIDFPETSTFPSLKIPFTPNKLHKLRIGGHYIIVSSILKQLKGGPLEDVEITIRPHPGNKKQGSLWASVQALASQWPATLRSILLVHVGGRPSSPWPTCDFSVFFHLALLQKLHIESWKMSSAQFEDLARNIPHIEDLKIELSVPGEGGLSFLEVLARDCRNIARLDITLDTYPMNVVLPNLIPSNSSLKVIVFETSSLNGPTELKRAVDVAKYLGLLFPSLQDVTSSRSFWKNVSELVGMVHDIRSTLVKSMSSADRQ